MYSNRFGDRLIVLRAVSAALEATTIDPPLHHVVPQPWDHIEDKTRPGRCEANMRPISTACGASFTNYSIAGPEPRAASLPLDPYPNDKSRGSNLQQYTQKGSFDTHSGR